ncbi:MAG: glycosyltransferase family 39 protein [Candidatus Sumerlaeia bacterium]|nr:glycosyltransferase family 39 protein [Candidatus Sumerlaeia bacterium]
MNPRTERLILALIVVAAAALRLTALEHSPPGFFRDEAEKGYNAWCLGLTGCDYQGRRLPLFINVFGVHTSALYQYATVPWVLLGGLEVWTTRLTAALAGVLTVFLLFWLARALFDPPTALVAAGVLAVSPWHIQFSRWAQQGVFMPLLFTIAAWGVVRFRQGRRWGLPIAAAAIALAAYAYDVGRVLAPLFLAWLAWIARGELRTHWKWTAASALILALLVAPTLRFVLNQTDEAMARFRRISIAQPGMTPAQVVGQFLLNYARHFSPGYLVLHGDRELRHSTGLTGILHAAEAPFFLLGLIFLFRRRDAAAALVLGWLFIGPVASSMTREGIPHALRSLAGVPALALAAAVGVVELARSVSLRGRKWLIGLAAGGETLCLAWFVYVFFFVYPNTSQAAWQEGVGEAIRWSAAREQVYPIWISEAVGGLSLPPEIVSPGEIFVAFFEQVPPAQFQRDRLAGTRFRVQPAGTTLNDLLTGIKLPHKVLIALMGEMPDRAVPAFSSRSGEGDFHAVGVYLLNGSR